MRWLGYILLGLGLALTVIGQIAIRIANPDMSETRLLTSYWWYWAICIVVYFSAMGVLRYIDRVKA
jgi:hypothetical protein